MSFNGNVHGGQMYNINGNQNNTNHNYHPGTNVNNVDYVQNANFGTNHGTINQGCGPPQGYQSPPNMGPYPSYGYHPGGPYPPSGYGPSQGYKGPPPQPNANVNDQYGPPPQQPQRGYSYGPDHYAQQQGQRPRQPPRRTRTDYPRPSYDYDETHDPQQQGEEYYPQQKDQYSYNHQPPSQNRDARRPSAAPNHGYSGQFDPDDGYGEPPRSQQQKQPQQRTKPSMTDYRSQTGDDFDDEDNDGTERTQQAMNNLHISSDSLPPPGSNPVPPAKKKWKNPFRKGN